MSGPAPTHRAVRPPRVQFAHGLEGSPQGAKARLLAAHFEACTPAMDTARFDACVSLHAGVLRDFLPDVLVASSFGGAVAVELLRSGAWSGPTLLLAQAALKRNPAARLPKGIPVWLVHGRDDTRIDVADSRVLASTGDPSWVRLIEVDDDHALHATVQSGRLVDIVTELLASAAS